MKKTLLRMSARFVAPILLATFAMTATASANSWLSQPSWAGGDEPAPRKGTSFGRESSRPSNLAPFSPGSNNVALDLGQVFLMGSLSEKYGDAIGARLHYTYGVSDLFAFDSSLGYSEHADGDFSMTTVLTGLRMNLSWYDKVIPYAVAGLGFYRPSYQIHPEGMPTTNVAPLLFGVHLGPGVDLELTKQFFFGAALTFHDVFGSTKQTATGPLDVGGTFTTFLVHAGVTF